MVVLVLLRPAVPVVPVVAPTVLTVLVLATVPAVKAEAHRQAAPEELVATITVVTAAH